MNISAWQILALAGILEAIWLVFLKMSEGSTKPLYTTLSVLFAIVSFYLLSKAIESIPISIAYAIWTSIGVTAAVLIGYLLFGEEIGAKSIFFITIILIGVVGLKLTS